MPNLIIANVVFKDNRWKKLPLKKLAMDSLNLIADDVLQKNNDFEISILATNDSEVTYLNNNFRGYNRPTNILSWPERRYERKKPGLFPQLVSTSSFYSDGSNFLGNLAVSFDRCSIEAQEENLAFEDHLYHLLIHGCLHLVGFDHENELDAELMEDIEKKLLSKLGIENPYRSSIGEKL